MNIIPRSSWGARAPSSPLTRFTDSKLSHIVTHWPGSSREIGLEDADATARRIRGYQAFHMDGRGWRDLGYNYLIDHAGRVWEGRGWNVGGHVLAAQNTISVGVCFLVGPEKPSDAMLNAGAQLREWIENERLRRALQYVGHSDWANKACPGPYVLPWTHAGMVRVVDPFVHVDPLPVEGPSKVGESTAAPDFPLGRCRAHGKQMYYGPRSELDHRVSGWANVQADGTRGADGLARWQERMAYRGWRITPDGLWGDETARVALAFQTEKGLARDSFVGPDTWAAAWASPIT